MVPLFRLSHNRQDFYIASLSRFSGGLFGFPSVHVAKIDNGITHINFNVGCQRFGKAKRHARIYFARIDEEVAIALDFSDVVDVEHCSFMLVGNGSFTHHLKTKECERSRMQMLQPRQTLLAET